MRASRIHMLPGISSLLWRPPADRRHLSFICHIALLAPPSPALRSPSFTASFHQYSRSPASLGEQPLSPISPPAHGESVDQLPSLRRASQGPLSSPVACMDAAFEGETDAYQLPLRTTGRFPSSASMLTPSVLGLTSDRIEEQAERLRCQREVRAGDDCLPAYPPPPTSPSVLGLQFLTPPPTADSSPTATEPATNGWIEADVRWTSEILLGLSRGVSNGPCGPGECEDVDEGDLLSESSDSDDAHSDGQSTFLDDIHIKVDHQPGIFSGAQSLSSTEQVTSPTRRSAFPSAAAASHGHRRAGEKRWKSTASNASVDLAGPLTVDHKRAWSKEGVMGTYDALASRPFGCEFCSERFLRKVRFGRSLRKLSSSDLSCLTRTTTIGTSAFTPASGRTDGEPAWRRS